MLFPHRCNGRRLLALLLTGWALSSHAQPRLTADEAVQLAMAQPHVRARFDAGVEHARSDVLAARTWANPTLELEQEREDGDAGAPGRETSVVLSQPFELGGRRGLRRDAAEQGVAAAQANADYERARLRADVLRAYYAAVAAERRNQAQSRLGQGLQSLATAAGQRRAAGDLSGYESRRIAQAHAQSQARAAEADADARAARARLAGQVGEQALTAELDPTLPTPTVPTLQDDARSAELDVLRARRDHAEARARAERRFAVPVDVGVGTKRTEHNGLRDEALLLQVGVPLPLFDRNQAARARAAAEASQTDADYQRALLETRARRAAVLEQATRLSASARSLLDTAVPEAERLTAIARSSYAEGELDLVGLLDAYAAEADVIDQALQQQTRALDAQLELELLAPLITAQPDPTTQGVQP